MITRLLIAVLFGHAISNPPSARADGESKSNVTVNLTAAEQSWLDAHPEVRWGVDPNWAPFSCYDQHHNLVGIDADLTRLVARRVGMHLRIVTGASWADVFARAKEGEIDFLSGTAEAPERLEAFDYTREYGSFPVVIITRNEAPFLTTMPNLASLTIALPHDYVATARLQHDLPSGRFILTANAEEALELVAHRDAQATVLNLAVATRGIRIHALTTLKISGVTPYEFPLRFAVRKDALELTSILNKGLATITGDELESIYAAHLTPDLGRARDWGKWRHRAVYATLAGAGIIGFMIFWNARLKKEIRVRKAVEQGLLEARQSLQQRTHELADRVREVERLNEEMQVANQDLDSFSSSVSHDLRGPLIRMSSFAELLQKEAGRFLSKRHAGWLALLIKESKHMDMIIHDLLEFARLGRRDLRIHRVNMVRLLASVIEDYRPQLRERDVLWQVGRLPEIWGDPNLLRHALASLVDNALKYTNRATQTRIKIDVVPEGPDSTEAIFYVQDNGRGFDMKEARKIFDPFERLPQASDHNGVGIGLANVRRIIQKHGGRIWCESAPEKGATFFFTLTRCLERPWQKTNPEERHHAE